MGAAGLSGAYIFSGKFMRARKKLDTSCCSNVIGLKKLNKLTFHVHATFSMYIGVIIDICFSKFVGGCY